MNAHAFTPCMPIDKSSNYRIRDQHQLKCNLQNQSSPDPSSANPSISRRTCLNRLNVFSLAAAAAVTLEFSHVKQANAGGPPKETILNSILSAYGLPTISDKAGFSLLTVQYDRLVLQFEHPAAWVVTRSPPNATAPTQGRVSGLTAADYRRAEGVAFFVSPTPQPALNIKDVPASFIAEVVTPGDATGSSPEVQVVKDQLTDDGYRIIETTYESTTFSGYVVERRAKTRATVLKDGKLYALNASCTANRWKKMINSLNTTLDSFRVFIL